MHLNSIPAAPFRYSKNETIPEKLKYNRLYIKGKKLATNILFPYGYRLPEFSFIFFE